MAKFLHKDAGLQEVPLNATMYREAAEANMSLPQFINHKYPTGSANAERYGSTWNQLLASEGIVLRDDRKAGLRASTMAEIANGTGSLEASVTTKEGVPASRILYPAVIFEAIEDRLQPDMTTTPAQFERMIAVDNAIAGDRYEQPVLNMSVPQAARSQTISQLAMPAAMMLLTTSDRQYKIPTFGLGLEVSDQAARAFPMDFIGMSVARQIMAQRLERAQGYILNLLQGDVDNGESSLATLGYSVNASTLDATATAGTLTQKAWVRWLTRNGTKRSIDWVVTDLAGAMAIENRTGRPTIQSDNPNSKRIDTLFQVANPTWKTDVNLFLTDDANWPAGTIMGLDSRYAVRRVRNVLADYQAVESYVMRRSTSMRFDFGEHVTRLFPEAFDTLVLV